MASGWYSQGLKECLDGTIQLGTTTVKLMLLSTATPYTFNSDDLVVDAGGANDPADAETNVSGYTRGWGGSGRKTITVTLQQNTANNRVDIALQSDPTWTALGAGQTLDGALLIKEGGANDTTSRLIAYFDFTTNVATNGGDITLDFATLAAGGNLQITV